MDLPIRVKRMQDESSHWYWIPEAKIKFFNNDLDVIGSIDYMDDPQRFDDFEMDYNHYRTGGSPDNPPAEFENQKVEFI